MARAQKRAGFTPGAQDLFESMVERYREALETTAQALVADRDPSDLTITTDDLLDAERRIGIGHGQAGDGHRRREGYIVRSGISSILLAVASGTAVAVAVAGDSTLIALAYAAVAGVGVGLAAATFESRFRGRVSRNLDSTQQDGAQAYEFLVEFQRLERALRRRSARVLGESAAGLPLSEQVSLAKSEANLNEDDTNQLRELVRLRNRLVHGEASPTEDWRMRADSAQRITRKLGLMA